MPEKIARRNKLRLAVHPVTGKPIENRRRVKIFVNDRAVEALEGESLAAALWANGLMALGQNPGAGLPRGMYCGIGHCYECRVTLDGIEDIRSCLIPVRDGMQVILQQPGPLSGERHGG